LVKCLIGEMTSRRSVQLPINVSVTSTSTRTGHWHISWHVNLPARLKSTAASQLVTRSTRHPVDSSQVSLSRGRLVTQSTRHKEAVNSPQADKTSKPYCRSS